MSVSHKGTLVFAKPDVCEPHLYPMKCCFSSSLSCFPFSTCYSSAEGRNPGCAGVTACSGQQQGLLQAGHSRQESPGSPESNGKCSELGDMAAGSSPACFSISPCGFDIRKVSHACKPGFLLHAFVLPPRSFPILMCFPSLLTLTSQDG